MKLNVGCGPDPDGDLIVDISRVYWVFGPTIANVIADTQHLPFKDKCVEELKAYRVLEHLADCARSNSFKTSFT